VKEVIFHPQARTELDESVALYESRLDGLGQRFLEAVEETTERIAATPDAGSPLEGGYRKRLVPGFPYSLIYRVWEDYAYLVAVAHQHRRPDYWRRRTDRR
jgi:plasmid stabilization system protein ParE